MENFEFLSPTRIVFGKGTEKKNRRINPAGTAKRS